MNTLVAAVSVALMGFALQPGETVAAPRLEQSTVQDASQSFIITFTEAGLVNYRGDVAGLSATAPGVTSRKLDVSSPAAIAYESYLQEQRQSHIGTIQSTVGRLIHVTHHYAVMRNGIAADLTASEAEEIARLPGVASVVPAGFERLTTYRGPQYIGADTVWSGANTPHGLGSDGRGILAAILDGGTASNHPSFANDETCGFSASEPKLKVKLDCHSTNSAGICNGSNPEANPGYGHGVHTSATVAGNTIDNTVTPAPAIPDGMTMSGVAPCATILHYKVCATNTCNGAAIAAGIDNAVRDNADVLNFSISGGLSPWGDNNRMFLDAVTADVFVAAAAGNTREGDTTPVGKVNHRGPWVMTVAASTQDMVVGPNLSVVGPGTPPEAATDVPMNPGSNPQSNNTPTWMGKPIKTYLDNIEGCTASGAFPPGTFTGSVAVLRRGTCPFAEKSINAAAAGAELVVIANNTVGSLNMNTDGATVPTYSITKGAGDAIISFLGGNSDSGTVDIEPIGVGVTKGDVIADFSYRGPTPNPLRDLTKPDISAPGVDIYAATDPASGNYEFMSGTSMATPHVAGAAALIRSVHPDWSVIEVKSALQTTAKKDGFLEDESTPWNIDTVGSGRADLTKAALVGFTMDETTANFLAANPSGGSISVRDLNLPAIRNLDCSPECTFTRTLKNVLETDATWTTSFTPVGQAIEVTVDPPSFTIAPGATQEITITAAPPPATAMTSIGFGYLDFTEVDGRSPVQHFSVAIRGDGPQPVDVIFADGFDGEPVIPTPVDLVLDDGTYESAIGWIDQDTESEFPSLWLNRFSPDASNFPLTIDNVKIMWPNSNSGNPGGKEATILIYFDADADGDPSNAVLLSSSVVLVGGPDVFESYPVSVTVPSAGDIYIGFEDTWAARSVDGYSPALYPAALDTDDSKGRSWVVANDDNRVPDKANLGNNDYVDVIDEISGGTIAGNWMIRGDATTVTGRKIDLEN